MRIKRSSLVLLIFVVGLFARISFAQDFTASTLGDYGNVTVMEVSGDYDAHNPDGSVNVEPRQAIAKEFFRLHKDEYDFLVVFSNFDFQMPELDVVAFYMGIKNDTRGIGRELFDYSALFGSSGKLQGTIDMGNVSNLAVDPIDPKFEFTLDTISHEMMHRWAAHVKFRDANGNISNALLGKEQSHWSFLLDTDASVMLGNTWQDNGDGTFISIRARKYYSPLDLYLMGFYDKSQVPPMFLIDNPDIDPARVSEVGVTISGTPRYITIDDVIAAEGERIPGPADSQKSFKTAFIFITYPGTFTGNELYGLENIRNGWMTRYSVLTDGVGLVQVASTPIDDIPINPGLPIPHSNPRSVPPSIDDGVRWLMSDQGTDGSWFDLSETTERDTAEAVYVLKNFETAQQSYSSGLQWLSLDSSENNDYLSRKIETLKNSGQDVTSLLTELLSRQNSDGGWGTNKGYASDPMDTSVVLKALAEASYSDSSVIPKAIDYLKGKQNADGGWGSDEESTIEATANVLLAFNSFQQSAYGYQLTDQITKGLTWLTERQNPDGGFASTSSAQAPSGGVNPAPTTTSSTIYETALAVMTLREFDVSADVTNNGLNYILAQQSEDGSWLESPYQTALAVEAVWKATIDPDLSVKTEDITFIPSVIKSLPTTAVINVNITNIGRTDVSQAKVVLYEGAPSASSGQVPANSVKIGEQTVAFSGQSVTTVTFSVTIPDGNEHRFYVSVDPENLIKESNEGNNIALNILFPEATYDFEALSSDITLSPNPVDIFQDVKITSKITNKGTMNAYNVQIKYYIDENGAPFDIATSTVDIPANSTITNEVTWRANKAGENLPITVLVDSFNSITEISEENNKAIAYLTVNSATDANLTVSYEDIVITPNPAAQEGNANISALVKNEGFSAASDVKVDFYKGTPGIDGVLLGSRTISSLNPEESRQVSIDWTNIQESGERIIYVRVDPDDRIKEIREDDNDDFTTLRILSLPDLAISTNAILFNPPAPKDGDVVSVNVVVQNRGEQAPSNITVTAYEGSSIIGSQIIPSIAGNSQASVAFTYDTVGQKGAHQITIVVDPDNSITEQSEDNNRASRTFGVQDSNLWLTEQYISPNGDGVKDSTQFFFRLAAPQKVMVLVVNDKGETVRTFSGGELDNVTIGSILWDGVSDEGMVVNDGQYQIKVVDANNINLGSLLVVIDNNRSPLTDAIGTKYVINMNLTCKLPNISYWKWLPDESGIVFIISSGNTEYPAGIYTMSPSGNDITRLIPWVGESDPTYNYKIESFEISPDSAKIAFVLYKTNKNTTVSEYVDQSQLWVFDRDGSNLNLLASYDMHYITNCYYDWWLGYRCQQNLDQNSHKILNIKYSPDSRFVLYVISQVYGNPELWVVSTADYTKVRLDSVGQTTNFRWSPDSKTVAYIQSSSNSVAVTDISGNKKNIFSRGSSSGGQYMEWLNDEKIVLVNPDVTGSKLWLLDATGGGNNKKLAEDCYIYPDKKWLGYLSISPDRKSFIFAIEDFSATRLYISDTEGNVNILYENKMCAQCWWPSFFSAGPIWSPDNKIAFNIYNFVGGNMDFYKFGVVDVETNKALLSDIPGLSTHDAYYTYFIKWLSDNKTILGRTWNRPYATYTLDAETATKTTIIPNSDYEVDVSPFEHYMTYPKIIDQSSVCYASGFVDLFSTSFIHNLIADVWVVKDKSAITLKGIASDINFEGYKLEYADANNPETWNLISPPSNVPVMNDIFTTWIPPYEGTFYVQLTAWDKAGNTAISRKRVSWGLSSSITNLYKSREIFSPNGDGVKDTIELNYTVLEPVHLEFSVYDSNDNLVKTFYKDHSVPTADYISWDGRNEAGWIVPDGKYKIKVFDYEFVIEVDNTPPDVNLALKGLIMDGGVVQDHADLEGRVLDDNLKSWVIEYGEGNNPDEWYEYKAGESALIAHDDKGNPILNPVKDDTVAVYYAEDLEWLIHKKFRLVAEDFAGNRTSLTTDFVSEELIIYKWTKAYVNMEPNILECGDMMELSISLFDYGDVIETIRNEISSFMIQYEKNGAWYDLKPISYPLTGDVGISLNSLQFDFNASYPIRVKAVDIVGVEYYSNNVVLNLPALVQTTVPVECKTASFTLEVSQDERGCDLLSNRAILSAELLGLSNTALKTLSFYLEKPESLQLLRQFDLSKEGWDSVTLDTSSMPEGIYPIKAVLAYLDLNDSKTKEISAANNLVVDRILPTAQITYPGKSLMLCPIKVSDSKGDWYGIPVEGIATDNNQGGRFELFYGSGENPASWMPAMTKKIGVEFPIKENMSRMGQLGVWDVTNLNGLTFSLKLKDTDLAGNTSCFTTNFSIDAFTEIAYLAIDKDLFSPNGDSVSDEVAINYQINEYATVDVKVFKLKEEADGSYSLDSTLIRTIVSGLQHLGETENTSWDGRDDSGTIVPDGIYGIAVYATDSCGNANMEWIDIEVDKTPPTTVITSPRPSDPLGAIVEVKGTADDDHFENYTLEAGQGDSPDAWLPISSNTSPVRDNILGTWNTFGLEGGWTLRLTAVDAVGNKNTATVGIDLGARKNLISDLNVSPKLFSPNGDMKLDSAAINYSLTDACQVTLDVQDSAGAVKKTYTTSAPSSGTYSFIWDGKDNSGQAVPDGNYVVKLHAALSSNVSVTQDETITVVVDSTPPTLDIKRPMNNSFVKGDVTVTGTIADKNLLEYSISYSGDSGTALLDKANQSRENYAFGMINGLNEGNYTLKATASDQGENIIEKNIVFTVDRTPPKVILDNPKEGEYYGTDKSIITINGSITETNLETYSLRYGLGDNPSQWTELQGGTAIPTNPQLFVWNVGKTSGIPDGLYTLSLFAKDKAGWEAEAKVKVKIDNTPPEAAITSPGDGNYIKTATEISGTAYDANLDKYTLELSEGQCGTAFKWVVMKVDAASVRDGVIVQWQALPPDGNYCLRLAVTDKLGNKMEAKVNVKVDTHPPAAPVLSGKVENKKDASLIWTQNMEPDFAGYNLFRNGQKINTSLFNGAAYLDQNLGEGNYTYAIKAIDLAGNESNSSNEVNLKIDTTGPEAKIISPRDGGMVSDLVDIKGTAYSSDDFKQYRIYIGQGSSPAAWNLIRTSPLPIPYGTLTQWDTLGLRGLYSIKLEGEDLTGNINSHQISVTIDDTAPAAPILISATANGSDVTLTWQANIESDFTGYLIYRNDQLVNATGIVIGDLKPYLIQGTTYVNKSVPDGKFRYYLIAMDQAGNMSAQSNIIEVNIDTHSPKATIVEPSGGAKFDSRTLTKAESPDIDIASIQFQYKKASESVWINLGGLVTATPYITYIDPSALGLAYGDYNLRAVATDKGGKTDSSPTYITITYTDLAAPQAPINLNALTNGKDVTLTWAANAESDLNGYNIYRISGSSKTKMNSTVIKEATYQITNLSDGSYTYEITAIDTHNNESKSSNSVSAKVYAPKIVQPYTPTGEKTLRINGNNTEANSTVEIFVETISGSELRGSATADAKGNFIVDVTLTLGENKIFAKATDGNGNVSRTSDMVVVVYNEPPAPPTGLVAAVEDHNVTLTWNANSESDLAGYNLYRNGEKLNMSVAITSGIVTASPSYYYSSPSYAFDLNPSTYLQWNYNNSISYPVWLEIDLPSRELISHLEIRWYSDYYGNLYAGKDYEIQVWSGYAWITQEKVTGNTSKDNTFDFNPSYRTDRVRIYITAPTNTNYWAYVGISEIGILKDELITQTSHGDFNLQDRVYKYTVTAVDYYGFESLPSNEAKAAVGDVSLPSPPQNLTAAASGSNVVLNWDQNTEPDLAGYNIYRNTQQGWLKINASLITINTYTDGNLLNGIYTYRVTAVDAVGNESEPSNEALASVSVALLPPPINLRATSALEGKALNLTWEYAGGAVAGYNLYRSATSGGPYSKINSSLIGGFSYTDSELTNGTAYFYVVTAVDSAENESVFSNEAKGVPSDSMPSSSPEIFFPTVFGVSVVLYNVLTDVAGMAEPAITVELFKDGVSAGKTTALDGDSSLSFSVESGISNPSISPDEKVLAYAKNGSLWLKIFSTGAVTMISQQGDLPVWSPDGRKLTYRFRDSKGYYRIGLYNLDKGTSEQLTTDTSVTEDSPSWSGDGKRIAFTSTKGGYRDVWMKDISSGASTQITSNIYASNPKISPDGKQVAYFIYQTLYILNISTGTSYQVDTQANSSSIDWSPDSKRLAFTSSKTGNNDIFVFDTETKSQKQITNSYSNDTNPGWSPDGLSIVFKRSENNGYSIRVAVSDELEQNRALKQNISSLNYLSWPRSGGIAYIDQKTLNIIYPAGYFSFEDISLDPGENIFYATAADSSGNVSEPSEAISVIFDSSLTPDVEITADDIFVYPPYPLVGEEATIAVSVKNKSQIEVKNVAADIYLMDSSGKVELLKSETILSIPPDSEEIIGVTWKGSDKAGTNTIIAVVDPEDNIHEVVEENNLAMKEVVVITEEGVFMTTTLDAGTYNAAQDVAVNIKLINSGIEKDVTVETFIEDESGNIVSTLNPLSVHLSYGAQQDFTLKWNTGQTFAGSYAARTILRDTQGVLSENKIPFTILPDIDIAASIVTDKANYGAKENAALSVTVKNNGRNYIISELTVKVKITDRENKILFTEDKPLANILPNAINTLNSVWNTGIMPPGAYAASVDIYINDQIVSTKSTSFNIAPSVVITGSIAATPSVVIFGNTIGIDYTIRNEGNMDITSLPIRLLVIDPESQSVLKSEDNVMDVKMGEAKSGQITLSTQSYRLKVYKVVLQQLYQGNTKNVADTSFAVKDGNSPIITIISPISGSYFSSQFNLTVNAFDDISGIDKVEYRIDSGAWKSLPPSDPASGKYSTTWWPTASDEGNRTISFRAADIYGNVSEPVSTTVAVEVIFGEVTVQPNPAYQGRDVNISYSIKNKGGDDIVGLPVKALILNSETQETLNSFEDHVDISMNSTFNGNFIAPTQQLAPGNYTVVLQAATSPEPKTLASATFEVKASIEISKTIPDAKRVLVWLNYSCVNGNQQDCLNQAIIEQALKDAEATYRIVLDKKEFETELRNPIYTDFMILGDQNPIEDGFSEEMREQVYAGKGLISSLFNRQNLDGDVFGMKYIGSLAGKDYPIELMESEIASPLARNDAGSGEFQSVGRALKADALNADEVIAWIVETTNKGTTKYPGILKRQYGEGKVLYYAFDLGATIGAYGVAPLPESLGSLLKNSLDYIHKPCEIEMSLRAGGEAISKSEIPRCARNDIWGAYQFVPVEITVKSLGSAFELRLTETYPSEIKLYDPITAKWITANPWVMDMRLEPGETNTIPYYVLAPDKAGSYTLNTEVDYAEAGKYEFYDSLSSDIMVDKNVATMTDDILTALNAIHVSDQEKAKINDAMKYIKDVQARAIVTEADVEKNIEDILKAVDSLLTVTSADIFAVRLMMDELFEAWEARQYSNAF